MDEKLQYHFLNLYSFALADTSVDVSEAEQLYSIALKKGVSKEEVDSLLDHPHKVKVILPTDIKEIVEQLYDIGLIIVADGRIDIREITSLRKFIRKFIKDGSVVEKVIESLIDSIMEVEPKATTIEKLNNIMEEKIIERE